MRGLTTKNCQLTEKGKFSHHPGVVYRIKLIVSINFIQKQVKINAGKIERRFGVVMTPFSSSKVSVDFVRKQLKDLSQKTHTAIQPVFVSNKIEQELKLEEKKTPIVNQQCVVYKFQCDLCDASYVGYTLRHLHQRVNEHKNLSSSIGRHYSEKHCIVPKDLDKQFFVLKKCRNKFDCLVHEMLLIRELTPSLNVQSDSIQAKLFA